MTRTGFFKIAASALVIAAGFSLGSTGTQVHAASDSSGKLSSMARGVEKLLAKHKTEAAVAQAERLVAASPDNASFRMLLGQAYLQSGRFKAASTSFSDVLELSPGSPRAALNQALAEIALGRTDSALAILDDNRDGLRPSDYGLALALAGQTEDGLRVLETAARQPDVTARTRQNLALAYAMAGNWKKSRAVMMQDLSPDLVDARIVEWVSFVRPKAAWDQVASLLKVTPAYDPGQPQALALNTDRAAPQQASVAPVDAPAPEPIAEMAAAEPVEQVIEPVAAAAPAVAPAYEVEDTVRGKAVSVALAAPEDTPEPALSGPEAGSVSNIVFAPRQEIVQRVPVRQAAVRKATPSARVAPLIRADRAPVRQAVVASNGAAVQSGRFAVQLGAYSSPKAAERAWSRHAGRFGLASADPQQASIKVRQTTLYRLSVAGLSNSEAGRVCTRIKAEGGNCFVRRISGEATPMWAKRKLPGKPTQLASR